MRSDKRWQANFSGFVSCWKKFLSLKNCRSVRICSVLNRSNRDTTVYYGGRFPFTQNFRKFRWKFPSGEKRVPFNSGPFAAQWLRFYAPNFKNVAVNSLEVVRPFKSCKWNTHFHRKVSNGKTGLPFQKFRLFRKFSSGSIYIPTGISGISW